MLNTTLLRVIGATFSASLLGTLFSAPAWSATVFTGSFGNPTPACDGDDVCLGIGTSKFSYGQPSTPDDFSSAIEFIPADPYTQRPSGTFLLGSLRITNGTVSLGTIPSFESIDDPITPTSTYTFFIDLVLEALTNGQFDTSDVLKIALVSTPNFDPDPRSPANADRVYFPDFPQLGTISVLEGSTVDDATYNIGVLAQFGSITPVGLQPIPGQSNGFVTSATPVPTPALLPGLVGMGMAAWRKRMKEDQSSDQA
jgi:hypothetical protein